MPQLTEARLARRQFMSLGFLLQLGATVRETRKAAMRAILQFLPGCSISRQIQLAQRAGGVDLHSAQTFEFGGDATT